MRYLIYHIILCISLASPAFGQTYDINDANFIAFLEENYPETVNNAGELNIEEAELINGELNCSNKGINDLDGIQFFTSLSGLYAGGNELTSLPDISGLTGLVTLQLNNNELTSLPSLNELIQLKNLIIYGNQLETLPGLNNLEKLTYLVCYNNNLQTLPELSNLTKLEVLEAGNNALQALPDLSNLTSLRQLLVYNNEITTIPGLEALTSLTDLVAYNNQLQDISGIEQLTSLVKLEVGHNQLESIDHISTLTNLEQLLCWSNDIISLPDLSQLTKLHTLNAAANRIDDTLDFTSNTMLRFVDLNSNLLHSTPDFSGLELLEEVNLTHNKLFIDDLYPLSELDNFNEVFDLAPQQVQQVGAHITVTEGDSLALHTGLTNDSEAPVQYHWFKNGESLTKEAGASYIKEVSTLEDSGSYYCEISSETLPGLKIYTDSFNVSVSPCIDTSKINYSVVSPIQCLDKGIIEAHYTGDQQVMFSLTQQHMNDTLYSESGVFEGLTKSDYQLSAHLGENCKRDNVKTVHLKKYKCNDVVITPDGDGVDDDYYFSQSGEAIIYDQQGKKMGSLSLPTTWDGTVKGSTISPGYYMININDGKQYIMITVIY